MSRLTGKLSDAFVKKTCDFQHMNFKDIKEKLVIPVFGEPYIEYTQLQHGLVNEAINLSSLDVPPQKVLEIISGKSTMQQQVRTIDKTYNVVSDVKPQQTQEPVQSQSVQPEPVQVQPQSVQPEPVQVQPEPVQVQPKPVQVQPPEPVSIQPIIEEPQEEPPEEPQKAGTSYKQQEPSKVSNILEIAMKSTLKPGTFKSLQIQSKVIDRVLPEFKMENPKITDEMLMNPNKDLIAKFKRFYFTFSKNYR